MRKMFGGGKTKRPSESKDEGERESKRANTEEPRTAWALVLEEDPEHGRGAYKLVVRMDKFECRSDVSDLAQSVKNELERMGYNVPPRIDIYAENPFAQDFHEVNRRILVPQIRGGDDNNWPKENYEEIEDDHRGSSTPYYVLTSKLKERAQVPMSISTSQLEEQMAQPSAPQAAAAQDTQMLIESIFTDSIGRLRIKLRSLQEIGRFKLQVHDSFAHTFNHLDVPIYPPSDKPVPYLIMDGLVDPDNLQHFVTAEQWSKFNMLLSTGAFAIMGVSGVGKTRTVLEYLARNWGFLFVVDTNFNGGITDFKVLFTFLNGKIKKGEEHRDENEKVATKALLCVLLGRLMLLDAVFNANEALTPLQWLWVQLYPSYMLRIEDDPITNIDVVAVSMAERLMGENIGIAELQAAIRKLTRSIMSRIGQHDTNKFPCFIDEAQILLKQYEGCFPSKNGAQGRALFTEALRAFDTLVEGPVFSGTGMKMSVAITALASHVGEKVVGDTGRIYSSLPLLMGPACRDYVERYLDMSVSPAEDQQTIVRALGGRPRLSAGFVGRALVAGADRDVMQVLNVYVSDMTGERASQYEKGSFFRIFANLQEEIAIANRRRVELLLSSGTRVGNEDPPEVREAKRERDAMKEVMRTLDMVALKFAITGKPQVVPADGDGALQLIERGLCPLIREGTTMRAAVAEPMAVMAVCNYQGLASYQWFMMHHANASARGFEFEPALMIAIDGGKDTIFSAQGQTHQAMETHPLIMDVGIELPAQFCGQWRLERRQGFPMGVTYAKDRITLDAWIANPTSTFYFPDNGTGADLVFFAISPSGRRALVCIQSKFYKNKLPENELAHAVETTDVRHVLLNRKDEVANTRAAERKGVLKLYQQQQLVNIGILVTFPGGSDAVTEVKRDDYLFIAASGSPRFEQMFTADFVEAAFGAKDL